jgi:hypothetical protein
MAGSQTECRCGRTIAVPKLSELRRMSGDDPYATNALDAIRLAYDQGRLPGHACVECGQPTHEQIHCHVTCERSFRRRSLVSNVEQDSFPTFVAGLLIPLVGALRGLYVASNTRLKVEQFGRDTSIEIAFCLCGYCRAFAGRLSRPRRLRRLASRVPEYRQLFAEYPRARVRLTAQ